MTRLKRLFRRALIILPVALLLFLAAVWLIVKIPPLTQIGTVSIIDRRGNELYEFLGREKARSSQLSIEDVSPWLVRATLFKEDRHFYRHFGINPLTLLRALAANIKSGRVVQGGSTITMQLAKILSQRRDRRLWEKTKEFLLACKLEMRLGKRQILTQYLNRVYYGNQLFGCQAAAQAYFGRPARDLTLRQSAFLAAITSAPSYYNPYIRFEAVKANSREMLQQMRQKGWIRDGDYAIAMQENLLLQRPSHPLLAPHFVLTLLQAEENGIYGISEIQTTLDLNLQREAEALLRGFIISLSSRGVKQGAALVLDNRSGEVLAWVGSTDFWDEANSGMIDGCTIKRQPGSALKPFLYSCALQNGFNAGTIIPDLPTLFRDNDKIYAPRNYSTRFSGPQRLRVALASSLNIPAVCVLDKVGKEKFLGFLQQAGFSSLDRGDRYYGLGLALGSGEVTLLELTRAYSALARGGMWLPERRIARLRSNEGRYVVPERIPARQILDPRIAFVISSILSDNDARGIGFSEDSPLQFPYQVAVKTGTSEGFRDNLCIGFTADYTVGVWVGNFEGKSMHNVSGVTGAGPVFHALMNLVYRRNAGGIPYGYRSLDHLPEGVVKKEICPLSGMAASRDCPGRIAEYFLAGTAPRQTCDWHRLIEVDNRNQLISTADTPRYFRESRLFVLPPAPFREWAAQAGYALPPLRYSELGEHEFRISFPPDRAIFQHLADLPAGYQSIRLKIVTSLRRQQVTWKVDNQVIASVGFPFSTIWHIAPGVHEISAASADNRYHDRISVVVQ